MDIMIIIVLLVKVKIIRHGFEICPLLEVILYSVAWSLWCTLRVHCSELRSVLFSDVANAIVSKVNRGHVICPL